MAGGLRDIIGSKRTHVYSTVALFLDAREAGGFPWNDARGPIKGKPSDVINETMISPDRKTSLFELH
jgi:hypothetical protein